VKDAPTLADVTPRLKEIIAAADCLIAYGTSTDFSHLSVIYKGRDERNALHDKLRDCAAEFMRYAKEHRPDVTHGSLTDAMACCGLTWHGTAHSSTADTDACRRVWEFLFPHYYDKKKKPSRDE